jgi:GT2 family glycosyltransferase
VSTHVVIVNWNGGEVTLRCLQHAGALERPPERVHLIDNGSTDGSVEAVQEGFPEVALQRFGENRGFAVAANAGIRAALDQGAEHVFLLNNDAFVEPDTLSRLLEASERRPEHGLYGCKIYRDLASKLLWCCGVSLGWHFNLCKLRGFGQPDRGRWDREEVVDSLTGCGLLVRREVFQSVGLFDEDYWVYAEDMDFCLRAEDCGYSCLYVPSARLEHPGSQSTGGGYSAVRKYLSAYGSALVVRKHGRRRPGLRLGFYLLDVLLMPVLLLKGLVAGGLPAAQAKFQGLTDGLAGRPLRRSAIERLVSSDRP